MIKLEFVLIFVVLCFGAFKAEDEENEPVKYVITNEVYFDISVKESVEGEVIKTGRVVIGVFGDVVPMTATNFVQLAKGVNRDKVNILFNFF